MTGSQRRVLLAQVRGRRPVEPVTLPLALLTARGLVVQRLLAVGNVGLAVLWIGLWVADPDSWRGLLVAGFVLLLAVSIPIAEREARRAARFVDRYGPVTSSPARQ